MAKQNKNQKTQNSEQNQYENKTQQNKNEK